MPTFYARSDGEAREATCRDANLVPADNKSVNSDTLDFQPTVGPRFIARKDVVRLLAKIVLQDRLTARHASLVDTTWGENGPPEDPVFRDPFTSRPCSSLSLLTSGQGVKMGRRELLNYAQTFLLASLRGLRLVSFKFASLRFPVTETRRFATRWCAGKVGRREFEYRRDVPGRSLRSLPGRATRCPPLASLAGTRLRPPEVMTPDRTCGKSGPARIRIAVTATRRPKDTKLPHRPAPRIRVGFAFNASENEAHRAKPSVSSQL